MNWKSRSTWITILVTAIVAWLLNRALDMTATGATRLLGKVVFVITLGSTTVRDAPYASAALNPYPLAPLLLFQFLSFVIAFLLGIGVGAIIRPFRAKRSEEIGASVSKASGNSKENQFKKKYLGPVLLAVLPLVILLASTVPFGIVSQAVLARRIYEADRDILAPYLTTQQLALMQAKFCSITTKAQYKVLIGELNFIASDHHVQLREEGSKLF